MKKNILLSLTTTIGSDWREKIIEASALGISEVSLFLTGITPEERKELYGLLEKSPIKNIPFVHLRSDMSLDEIDYLIKNFGTKIFNIHSSRSKYPFPVEFEKYSSIIYIENANVIPFEEELNQYAGLCLDFAHWENGIMAGIPGYENLKKLADKYKIGCVHISAIRSKPKKDNENVTDYSCHKFNNLDEFDYMKKYIKYLPEIISLELTNSFAEQLKAKECLEKIIL